MWRVLVILLCACALPLMANESATGWCENGNQTVTTGGVQSTTKVMRSYPQCTVTVFLTGTTTKATIYSDINNTAQANPFTSTTTGYWSFFAANGRYDIQLSSAGIASPYTIADVYLFDLANYRPNNVFAYPVSGVPGVIGVYNGSTTFYSGFTVNANITSNLVWTLPVSDTAGCVQSNGLRVLSISPCPVSTPQGPDGSVQSNKNGAFYGDANFQWNSGAQRATITGIAGTSAETVNGGYILANGGVYTAVGSWQGFNTNTDGALLRGLHIDKNVAGTAGGYINIAPITGNPVPLPGLSAFGSHTALIWVGGTNGMAPDVTFGVNTNLFIDAAGGFATRNTPFNSIQVTNNAQCLDKLCGGMFANSFTAISYVQTGHSSGAPAATTNDAFHQGALYFDDALGAEQVFNGTAWVGLGGGGGGGAPGGPTTAVQFNAGSSTFGGSSNFEWDGTNRKVLITTAAGVHPGLAITNGFAQTDGGYLVTVGGAGSIDYNAIQAPAAGMAALSFTAVHYIQAGNSNGAPPVTNADTIHAGALYWDCGGVPCVDGVATGSMQVWNGAAWTAIAAGGATTPGLPVNSVQFNTGPGTFAGSSNMLWDNTGRQLLITTASGATAGVAVSHGFFQSDGGLLVTVGGFGSVNYNAIQAPAAGMAARSFTATSYVQVGSGTVDPTATTNDTFHPGAMYYNTTSGLQVYNGTAFGPVGGGTGTPGGSNTMVQYNSSGSFAGSAQFEWNNSLKLLSITGIASTAGIALVNGFVQSDGGYATSASNNFNSFQACGTNFGAGCTAPQGGMFARSFTASTYIQVGQFAGSLTSGPSATTADSIHAGTIFWDVNLPGLRVFNGSNWPALSISSSGVSSLNTLVGALNIVGTANQIIVCGGVACTGTTITLTTPQSIATTSNVSFNSVTAVTSFTAQNAGANTTFQNSNGLFIVNGAGAVSAAGVISSTGATGGFNVTADTALNSIQSVGGVNVSSGGSANGVYQVHGTTVIDASRNLVNINQITAASAITANGGINAPVGTNTTIAIGTGNFYVRATTGSPSCSLVTNGWMAVDTSGNRLLVCIGGTLKTAALL